jgi:hypothetical protein
MEQEAEENQTVRNLDEFGQAFIYAIIFAFALKVFL